MRHGENLVRLQALQRAPPQEPTSLVVKPEGTCSEHETGTEELCDQVGQVGLHIFGAKPSESPEG